MLKRTTLCCLACMLVAVSLFLPGCGGDKQVPESTDKQGTSAQTQADTNSSGGGEVERLLAKSKGIDEIYFEFTVTDPDKGKEELSGKTWVKGNRFRNEVSVEGMTISYICDLAKNEAYMFSSDSNTAALSEVEPGMTDWFITPTDIFTKGGLDVSQVKIVGTETYDGYKCKVLITTDERGQEVKMWVWEEHGIPLRVEDVMVVEFNNVQIGSVPDTVFELPPGVRIEDMRN